MSLIDNLKKIDNKYIVFILLILVVFVIYFITKKENMTTDSEFCWKIIAEGECNNNEKCLWLKDAFVCTPKSQEAKTTVSIQSEKMQQTAEIPIMQQTAEIPTKTSTQNFVDENNINKLAQKEEIYYNNDNVKSEQDKSYSVATPDKSYSVDTPDKSYSVTTTMQDRKSFDEVLKICGNQDKINKIMTNMESIGKYQENIRNSNNEIDGLTDIFMDDKVYNLIDETINIFSSMTNDEMYCFYNNIYGGNGNYGDLFKNNQCRNIQELSNMNDMHSKINKIVNKYINLLVKLRKRLLNVQLFIINKDCSNITNKKNKFDNIIREYNNSLKRAFQILYIYPNEQKQLMNQIQ